MNIQNINGFQTSLGHGGRANKFAVKLSAPTALGSTFDETTTYLATAANFPAKTIETTEVHKQGRKINLPGDTVFPGTYTVTFYMDESHTLRKQMIDWMNKIDNFKNNEHVSDPSTLMSTLEIFQLKSNGSASTAEETASYTLYNLFPGEVSEVTVDDETNNTILKFDVQFTYTFWE